MADNLFEIIESASKRDKILSYLQHNRKAEIQLSDSELTYITQVDYADDLIRAHPGSTDKELMNMLGEKYLISPSKARNLLMDARYIHGTMAKPVKAYERMRVKEFLWEVATHAAGVEKFKEAVLAMQLIAKLDGLENPDDEKSEEQGGVRIIRPAFEPEILGVKMPENIDELVANLRGETAQQQRILNAINDTDS